MITLGCGGGVGVVGVAGFAARWGWRAGTGRITGVVSPLRTPDDAVAAGVLDPPLAIATAPPPAGVITVVGVGCEPVAGDRVWDGLRGVTGFGWRGVVAGVVGVVAGVVVGWVGVVDGCDGVVELAGVVVAEIGVKV